MSLLELRKSTMGHAYLPLHLTLEEIPNRTIITVFIGQRQLETHLVSSAEAEEIAEDLYNKWGNILAVGFDAGYSKAESDNA